MKRNLTMLLALVIVGGATEVNAQFFDRLGDAARRAAENAVERNIENKVREGVDKAFDEDTYKKKDKKQKEEPQASQGWACPSCGTTGNAGKFCGECGTKQPTGDGSWTCAACGHKGNTGKFCGECGTKQGGAAQATTTTTSTALQRSAAVVSAPAAAYFPNVTTPEELISYVPELPTVHTLATYARGVEDTPEATQQISLFDEQLNKVRGHYKYLRAQYSEVLQANVKQGVDALVYRQTGHTLEEVEGMSDAELEALAMQQATQITGMSEQELQDMAAKMENMSEEEQQAYIQNSGILTRVMQNAMTMQTTPAQAEQTLAMTQINDEMQVVQKRWDNIDKQYAQERQDVLTKIRSIEDAYEKQMPKPQPNPIHGLEAYTPAQEKEVAQLRQACYTECFTLWRNLIAKQQGVLRERLTECVQMDKLEAQYMQQSGMPSNPRTATWTVVDEYIDITTEVTSLPIN